MSFSVYSTENALEIKIKISFKSSSILLNHLKGKNTTNIEIQHQTNDMLSCSYAKVHYLSKENASDRDPKHQQNDHKHMILPKFLQKTG